MKWSLESIGSLCDYERSDRLFEVHLYSKTRRYVYVSSVVTTYRSDYDGQQARVVEQRVLNVYSIKCHNIGAMEQKIFEITRLWSSIKETIY